jgi:hypothetical protein
MFSVEASPFCGALGVAHRIAPDRWFGMEAGGGIPETHTQLADREASWSELLHAGFFLRMAPDDHAGLEIGLRTGIADRCESGSCEFDPGVYGGASIALLLGWRHWKLGPRVTVARFGQQGYAPRWEAWAGPVNIWYGTEW